ncbi:MAG: beta-ketoacyl-[acyl-carrier-protein] synthase II [Chloroflexi bacterium]|nr:beta-ketoacyl-[acyl-carrier-protein] synthase II [Chloroflexota bacterium]
MRSEKKVVITGIGAVTCLGNNVDDFWNNIKNGKSGIETISIVPPEPFPCKVSGEIKKFSIDHIVNKKESRRMARFTQFAIHAANQAIIDSNIKLDNFDRNRIGILLGVGSGGLPETDQQAEIKSKRGVMRMSPFFIPMMLPNMAAANISRIWGITGYTNTCTTACAASTQAIGEASEVIKRGTADIVITGGSEAGICELGMGGFSTMHALTNWQGDPSEASKPFDADRDGFAPSEGAGILILESEENAKSRNAKIYAEILGWGVSSDAFHLVQPHKNGYGASLAMNLAINYSKINSSEINYINAHGTSTPSNDKLETLAIKKVFGKNSNSIPISSTKSMIGHSLGASGALEAIVCVKTINDSVIHPTINLNKIDPNCDLDYVPNKKREQAVDITLSNSFGFGGQNACLVLKKYNH